MQTTKKVRRPFHETIVEAIRQSHGYEFQTLATLIKATKIPKGHDEIIVAWNQRRQELGLGDNENLLGVPADLLEQKQKAAEEEKAKAEKKEQAGVTSS